MTILALVCAAAEARAQQSSCIQPAAPAAGRAGRGPAAPPAPRNATITAIPGVVAADAKWTKIWQQGGNSADGILANKDGSVLVAQEDYDAVPKDRHERQAVRLRRERQGVGSVAADGQGGAYFTSGCLFYANPNGAVTVAAEDLRTNGIAFSPDDKILYVTNGPGLVAFDIAGPGKLTNRRDFAKLDSAGDGTAVDTEGRLYVTINAGVQVIDKSGTSLGVIPTPRGVISVAFAGPNRKTLFVVGSGADDANGQPIREGPQQTAATVYTLPMLAQGVRGRAK